MEFVAYQKNGHSPSRLACALSGKEHLHRDVSRALGMEAFQPFVVGRVHKLAGMRRFHDLGCFRHVLARALEHREDHALHRVHAVGSNRLSIGIAPYAAGIRFGI